MAFEKERSWWDKKATSFDTIYSGRKNKFSLMLDRFFRWDMKARMFFALGRCAVAPEKSILDVACGTGHFAHLCAERCARVVGVDLSEKMLEKAIAVASARGLSGCVFRQGNFLELFFEEQFDVVVSLGLFDYLAEPVPFLIKMFSLSRGPVIASFPKEGTLRAAIRFVRLSLQGRPVFFYSEDRIRAIAAAAGGIVTEIRSIGQLYCVVFGKAYSRESVTS